jgi:hypothetical protein
VTVPSVDDPALEKLATETRIYMRDYPELNRLTAGYDHSPRHLKWAVLDTLSDWQSTPPFIGITLQNIIDLNWVHPFRMGVIINALTSLAILHMRNHLSYSDGGVNVQTENPQLIQAWLQMMQPIYEQKKQRALVARNISNALSTSSVGVHSEYYFTSSFYGIL